MAEAVIGRPPLRILEHVVGFVDFLELVLGRLVAGPRVRVILLGELAKGALQLLLVGVPLNAQSIVVVTLGHGAGTMAKREDRKSTRLNSSHRCISYAVFCLKKKNKDNKCQE